LLIKVVNHIKNILAIVMKKLLVIHCETYENSCKGCIFDMKDECKCKIDVPVEWGKL
jgi:hypothetical protein